jgi:hypothetical protein
MSDKDDLELDQLLARGRLSGRQYDEIERRVLEQVAPRSKRWPIVALLPAAALAAVFAVLVLPSRAPSQRSTEASPLSVRDGFTARGSSASSGGLERAAALVDVGCAGRPAHVCRLGDTLMFSVNGNQAAGYLLAVAERVDGPPARIWYFPTTDGTAPRVEPRATTTVLSQGVRLGPPHALGKYKVTAWLSPEAAGEAHALEQYEGRRPTPIVLEIVE